MFSSRDPRGTSCAHFDPKKLETKEIPSWHLSSSELVAVVQEPYRSTAL